MNVTYDAFGAWLKGMPGLSDLLNAQNMVADFDPDRVWRMIWQAGYDYRVKEEKGGSGETDRTSA